MPRKLPGPLESLLEQLRQLPGLGPKSALRVAMALLAWPESETRRLGSAIHSLRDELSLCSRCGAVSSVDPCPICDDPARARDCLCLVPEWDALLALEEGGFYNGQYLILGGLLEPLKQRDSQTLEIDRLLNRLGEGEIRELILALGSTLEADNTASFLNTLLKKKFPGLRVTRLAQGLPLGAEVKYMDKETLRQSLRHRQNLCES